MYKNQLQELAQRSCFGLPAYVCTREGPDHAPRFKATVTFNGETFHGPTCCTTLRQAEHAAAEAALALLSLRGPSTSLTATILDETGVYKNLLQETAHRAGLKLPAYTTVRSGPGHSPVFASTVELAGLCFAGDAARTKKQAEKNAAMAAWSSLKQMPEAARKEPGTGGEEPEQEHVAVARVLAALRARGDCGVGRAVPPLPKQHCVAGSSSSSALNPALYRRQWQRPLSSSAAQMRTRHAQPQPPTASSRILPPLHLLQRPAPPTTSRLATDLERERRRINAAELVRMLERATVADRADAMPSAPWYYPHASAACQHTGAPRSFGAGGFHSPAMAVSVRSVIPVCSAPPSPPQPAAGKDEQGSRNGPPAQPVAALGTKGCDELGFGTS
ncbi:hypothetical protein ACQ4PT_051571 [Festuca glaucescens]